jgi:hypothetical protein
MFRRRRISDVAKPECPATHLGRWPMTRCRLTWNGNLPSACSTFVSATADAECSGFDQRLVFIRQFRYLLKKNSSHLRLTITSTTSRTDPQVPKPLCITGCNLSELCTTHAVRQSYQDVTARASASASAVSTFICSLFSSSRNLHF